MAIGQASVETRSLNYRTVPGKETAQSGVPSTPNQLAG
jgi:hypothetical protein